MMATRPRQEDPYRRFFWMLLPAAVLMSGGGIATFITMRIDGATIKAEMANIRDDVQALKSQAPVYSEAVTMLKVIATQVGELRQAIGEGTRDRYTGAQASEDRRAMTDRITRLEDRAAAIDVWRASVEEARRQADQFRPSGP